MGLVYFLAAVILLLLGYAIYSRVAAKIFGIDATRVTSVMTKADGVDYVPLKPYKIFFIQLLNIAGLGPVFGPILGALYGPAALLWVVFGSIFAGAVHDFLAGSMSLRYGGASYHWPQSRKICQMVFIALYHLVHGAGWCSLCQRSCGTFSL